MAKHDLPQTRSTLCKFCHQEVHVRNGEMTWMKPSDQFLVGHSDETDFPFCPGSGTALHENLNGYTHEPGYPRLWEVQKHVRLGALFSVIPG
jgi:hypothetical protein